MIYYYYYYYCYNKYCQTDSSKQVCLQQQQLLGPILKLQYLNYLRTTTTCLPGVNFINILCTHFLYERHFGSFFYVHVIREKLPIQCSYEKFVCKMLMKLTTAHFLFSQGRSLETKFHFNVKTFMVHRSPLSGRPGFKSSVFPPQ